jgi:hypothetical protein
MPFTSVLLPPGLVAILAACGWLETADRLGRRARELDGDRALAARSWQADQEYFRMLAIIDELTAGEPAWSLRRSLPIRGDPAW